jgi:hypothetical protein
MLSRQFRERLKLSETPQYKIAIAAGVHPGLLSKWVIGAQPVRRGDPRIVKIGAILGLKPQHVFTDCDEDPGA